MWWTLAVRWLQFNMPVNGDQFIIFHMKVLSDLRKTHTHTHTHTYDDLHVSFFLILYALSLSPFLCRQTRPPTRRHTPTRRSDVKCQQIVPLRVYDLRMLLTDDWDCHEDATAQTATKRLFLSPVYTIQPVVKRVVKPFDNRLYHVMPCIQTFMQPVVNVKHVHVRYMLSPVRLSSVCRMSVVCNVRAPYSGGWNIFLRR